MEGTPITVYNPAALFDREIRIDIGNGRILSLEFLKPDTSKYLIDVAASIKYEDKEPEDLVVLRPTKETVEILEINANLGDS